MSVARTTCTDCGLPYYEDRSQCPYCDRAGGSASRTGAGATAEAAGDPAETAASDAGGPAAGTRPRRTCPTCGLPHYGGEGDDCPYCERAEGATTAGGATASESAGGRASDRAVSHEATDATADAGSDGSAAAEGRSRATCPECGLPYYADDGDCPYCERAGALGDASADDTTGAEASTPEADPAATDRSATEATGERGDRGGIIARVKRLFTG